MKEIIRDGKTITVFDNVEEMKWFYHARLCKDSSDRAAQYIHEVAGLNDVAKANEALKAFSEPCEVKAT